MKRKDRGWIDGLAAREGGLVILQLLRLETGIAKS